MTKNFGSKILLLTLFLIGIGLGILYLSRSANDIYADPGNKESGMCGESECSLLYPAGCFSNNPYWFRGKYRYNPSPNTNPDYHCHRCTAPNEDCGWWSNNFSYCVASCSGGPSCGDDSCDAGETCDSCSEDCGVCEPPPTGTIQGYKVLMPGNVVGSPASEQTVSLDGGSPTTANPYFYVGVSAGAHTVAVTVPFNYDAGSTLCYNVTTCHDAAPTPGSSIGVAVPGGGYADLWWHYTVATTAPSGLNCTAVTATSAQLNWTPGAGGVNQLIRLDTDLADVTSGCPGGVGPGPGQCLLKDDAVPLGQSTYGTGSILSPETLYYWRIVEYRNATHYSDANSSCTTLAQPWLQTIGGDGDIHANNLAALRVAPVGENARWLISARGSVTGTSQEDWIAQYYPERNADLNLNTPIQAPSYAALWERFGQGIASDYSGPTLPNSNGVYLISGNKTVSGIFNQAAGTRILIFVAGDLTINAEIRVPATSVVTFIVSGKIDFSKSLAGGGAATDSVGGIYIAQGRINTASGINPDEVTRQLAVEGALISLSDTITLGRNLDLGGNLTTPAESISLPPKYYVLMKPVLGRPKIFYQEVPAGF